MVNNKQWANGVLNALEEMEWRGWKMERMENGDGKMRGWRMEKMEEERMENIYRRWIMGRSE